MTLFVDASALVAIISGEADASDLADRIERDPSRLCSAMSVWETMAALCRSYGIAVATAREQVHRYLSTGNFRFVSIGEQEFEIAADAYTRYGKGRHAASLNMGDCFRLRLRKGAGGPARVQGRRFTHTDVRVG